MKMSNIKALQMSSSLGSVNAETYTVLNLNCLLPAKSLCNIIVNICHNAQPKQIIQASISRSKRFSDVSNPARFIFSI